MIKNVSVFPDELCVNPACSSEYLSLSVKEYGVEVVAEGSCCDIVFISLPDEQVLDIYNWLGLYLNSVNNLEKE